MQNVWWQMVIGLALAIQSAGCADAVSPASPPIGTYVLRTVGGEPLPALLRSGGAVVERVLADTLTLFEDGSARRRLISTVSYPSDASAGEQESDTEVVLTWSSHGTSLELNYLCPPEVLALCVEPPHFEGRFIEMGLRLDRVLGARTPLAYEQVRP